MLFEKFEIIIVVRYLPTQYLTRFFFFFVQSSINNTGRSICTHSSIILYINKYWTICLRCHVQKLIRRFRSIFGLSWKIVLETVGTFRRGGKTWYVQNATFVCYIYEQRPIAKSPKSFLKITTRQNSTWIRRSKVVEKWRISFCRNAADVWCINIYLLYLRRGKTAICLFVFFFFLQWRRQRCRRARVAKDPAIKGPCFASVCGAVSVGTRTLRRETPPRQRRRIARGDRAQLIYTIIITMCTPSGNW